MTPTPGQSIALPTLPNLRDLGGWPTTDGSQVRSGVLYRSTDLSRLDDADRQTLTDLGLRTIYDLRTLAERTGAPDIAIDGATEVAVDVLADATTSIPANLGTVLADPAVVAQATDALGDGKAAELIAGTYREIVTLPSALAAYRRFFEGLAGGDPGPVLFHCTTGKDRTGWAAAVLLSLLGVREDDVYQDYLLTNEQLIPALTPLFDDFAAAGGDPDLLRPVLGVDRSYLDAAFDEMRSVYGDVDCYVTDGLGFDTDLRKRLRDLYLHA